LVPFEYANHKKDTSKRYRLYEQKDGMTVSESVKFLTSRTTRILKS